MQFSSNTYSPKFIDLFAGCGGLSLGLEEAGLLPIAFSEINSDATKSYVSNRSKLSELNYFETTQQILFAQHSQFKGIDLICGGPPCQGFSLRGRRRTQRIEPGLIPSNQLYLEMVEVVNKLQPKMFLFENVFGIMSARWAKNSSRAVFDDVFESFSSLRQYVVTSGIVRACDFGVPQLRRRVLIVGIHRDLAKALPKTVFKTARDKAFDLGLLPRPTFVGALFGGPISGPQEVIGDLLDSAYELCPEHYGSTRHYPSPPLNAFQRKMRRRSASTRVVLKKGDPLKEHEYSKHKPETRQKYMALIENAGRLPTCYQTKKFALTLLPTNWPTGVPNITITSLADDYVHYCQPRTLTVRECARFQTFPDWYKFFGKRTTGGERRAGRPLEGRWDRDLPKYTQIANAVPVFLAKAIGRHFLKLLVQT